MLGAGFGVVLEEDVTGTQEEGRGRGELVGDGH